MSYNKVGIEHITVGGRFGDFTVEGLLGKGSLGAVFLMRAVCGKLVAVKVLRTDAMTHKMRRGLADEAKLLAKRRHKSLVSFHDVGIDPVSGLCYIDMDYIPGGTLAERIKKRGRFSVADAVSIVTKIASALEVLHANGFVHGDVKPGNIMFAEDGTPVLTEPGILRFEGGCQSAFMAPEQLAGSRDINARADIYSLGAVLWEMLVWQGPEVCGLESRLLARAKEGAPIPDAMELRPDVPDSIASAIAQLCAPQPERRPATVRAAAELLQKALSAGASALAEKGRRISPPPAVSRRRKARRRFLVSVCLISLLSFGVAVSAIYAYAAQKVSKSESESALAGRRAEAFERRAVNAERSLAEMEGKIAEYVKRAADAETRALEFKRYGDTLERELKSIKMALRVAEVAVGSLSARREAPNPFSDNSQGRPSEPSVERQHAAEMQDGGGETHVEERLPVQEEGALADMSTPEANAHPLTVDIRLIGRKKLQLGKESYYEYKGEVVCRMNDDETAEVTLEAFQLFKEPKSLSSSLAADVAQGVKIDSFKFGGGERDTQEFVFASPMVDNAVATLEKGVLVRAVADGRFLSAASFPKCDKWIKAAAALAMPEGGDGGEAVVETVSTNIYLMTEWAFNQAAVGLPQALINDVVECLSHSTRHIIAYDVVPESGMEVYSSGSGNVGGSRGGFNFVMSLSGYRSSKTQCTFRCWDREYPRFDLAPKQHRASVSGTVSTRAEFKVNINTGTGDWSLVPYKGAQPGSYKPSGFVIDVKGNVSRRQDETGT